MSRYTPVSALPMHFHNPDTGELASGFTLYSYRGDSTTPIPMYTDKNGTSAGSSITLNSAGYPEVSGSIITIHLDTQEEYKFILQDTESNQEWTLDEILPSATTTASAVIQWPTATSNSSDPEHDIDFSAGSVIDSGNDTALVLASALTKRIDSSWAAGSGSGGLFSGTVANSTTYYAFIIQKDSDETVEAGFDTSSTAANIPAGYTKYRALLQFSTDGSANIDTSSFVALLHAEIAKRGEDNGTASLNSSGEVPDSQLRSEITDAASVVEVTGTNTRIKSNGSGDVYIEVDGTDKVHVDATGAVTFADSATFNSGTV